MKSSTIKTIVVRLASDNVYEIDIDTDTFDDPHFEAATRAIEQCKIKKYGIVRPITICFEKKDANNLKKYHYINSYWLFVNAACYGRAEELREKFKAQNDVDLAKEPMRGSHGKS